MSNMSYCRFENTLGDLRDCITALEDRNIQSVREKKKAKAMLEMIAEFLVNEDLVTAGDIHGEVIVNYEGIEEFIAECGEQEEEEE
jgi:succinylglutamate desuccinylase